MAGQAGPKRPASLTLIGRPPRRRVGRRPTRDARACRPGRHPEAGLGAAALAVAAADDRPRPVAVPNLRPMVRCCHRTVPHLSGGKPQGQHGSLGRHRVHQVKQGPQRDANRVGPPLATLHVRSSNDLGGPAANGDFAEMPLLGRSYIQAAAELQAECRRHDVERDVARDLVGADGDRAQGGTGGVDELLTEALDFQHPAPGPCRPYRVVALRERRGCGGRRRGTRHQVVMGSVHGPPRTRARPGDNGSGPINCQSVTSARR